MSKDRGVGLVGAGRVADLHVAAISAAGARLVGVATSTPDRAEEARMRLGAEVAFDSVDDLLSDDAIEVVHITSPSALHPQQVEMALRAGKHVICEKPLALDVRQATRLTLLAEDLGLVGTVAYTYRFHPFVREARARRANIGTLSEVHASYRQQWLLHAPGTEWRLDAALNGPSRAFADVGSHLVDLMEFVSGDRVERLAATTASRVGSAQTGVADADDAVAMTFGLRGGAIGTLAVSQVSIGHENTLILQLYGSEGSLGLDQRDPTRLWIAEGEESREVPLGDLSLGVDARRMGFASNGSPVDYAHAFTSFVLDSYAAIDGEEPEGLPTFRDCVRSLAVRQTVMASAATGAWATVPPAPVSLSR